MKKLKWIGLSIICLVLVAMAILAVLPVTTIEASTKYLSVTLDNFHATYVPPTVTKDGTNNFGFNFTGSKNRVHIGSGTSQFLSKMVFGAFDDECLITLTPTSNITGNLGQATLSGTGENASIVVENTSWKFEYRPVPPTAGFNEYGGVDYKITIKKKTSYNQLSFTYSGTNVSAYLQPA